MYLGSSSYAQFGGGSLEKANKYYERFSYHKAIEKYIESQDYSIESQRNLAVSYYKIGDTQKAEELFALLVTKEDKIPEDVFTYASILQQNKKYEKSEDWINSLASVNPVPSNVEFVLLSNTRIC